MKLVSRSLLVVIMFATGCGGPVVVGSKMTAEEQRELNDNFALLDNTLREHAPFIHAKLAPPATEEELAELRAALSGNQIDALELWYRWHNGCIDRLTDIIPLGRMLSISEALADRRDIQSLPFVDAKRKNALKILEDVAGDGFFLDITSPRPRVFYDMLEESSPSDYGSLEEFVGFITEVHAAGLSSKNENGMVAFDFPHYDKLQSEYRARLTKR